LTIPRLGGMNEYTKFEMGQFEVFLLLL